MARPRRLPGSSEVCVGCPPLGRAERTFWVRLRPYGWISSFFTAVFCSTQLASSIAVPGVPLDPQEELMVTRDHRSVPFWDLLSQAEGSRLSEYEREGLIGRGPTPAQKDVATPVTYSLFNGQLAPLSLFNG